MTIVQRIGKYTLVRGDRASGTSVCRALGIIMNFTQFRVGNKALRIECILVLDDKYRVVAAADTYTLRPPFILVRMHAPDPEVCRLLLDMLGGLRIGGVSASEHTPVHIIEEYGFKCEYHGKIYKCTRRLARASHTLFVD